MRNSDRFAASVSALIDSLQYHSLVRAYPTLQASVCFSGKGFYTQSMIIYDHIYQIEFEVMGEDWLLPGSMIICTATAQLHPP